MGQGASSSSKTPRSSKSSKAPKAPKAKPVGDLPQHEPPGSFQLYQTHDNGGYIFRVFIDKTRKVAFITSTTTCSQLVNLRVPFQKVWIGKSKGQYSRTMGAGPQFDGNSILFMVSSGKYLFVGECIKSFTTDAPIVRFESPCSAINDVPYPYAVDANGFYYLLTAGNHGKGIKARFRKKVKDAYGEFWDGHADSSEDIDEVIIAPRC